MQEVTPQYDEAAALAEDDQWAQNQKDSNRPRGYIKPGATTAPAYSYPDETTMAAVDEQWLNTLKDR